MKLSKKGISALSDRAIMTEVMLALEISEQWMLKLISANKKNGPLTTMISVWAISKRTGLPIEEIVN